MYKIIRSFRERLGEWVVILWLNLCIKVCFKILEEIILDIKLFLNIKFLKVKKMYERKIFLMRGRIEIR